MSSELCKLVNYFSSLDGKSDWDVIEIHALELAHPHIRIALSNEDITGKENWLAHMKQVVENGLELGIIWLEVVDSNKDIQIRYKLRMCMPDGTISIVQSNAIFRDGLLLNVRPDDGNVQFYDKLFQKNVPDEMALRSSQSHSARRIVQSQLENGL